MCVFTNNGTETGVGQSLHVFDRHIKACQPDAKYNKGQKQVVLAWTMNHRGGKETTCDPNLPA